ncbi:MAG: hypothetical protein RTV31_00475 [Candidatus Thorarchaeota archaeon]
MKLMNMHGKVLSIVFLLTILLISLPISSDSIGTESTSLNNNMTLAADPLVIVIDYSHGQNESLASTIDDDIVLGAELESMGYTVVWAKGGLNSTVLASADGLLMSSILGFDYGYLASEITAISNWFDLGSKFLWIGCDSDYTSLPAFGQFINDNATAVLESVESHVYPEPTAVYDSFSNAGATFRPVANRTSTHPVVSEIVDGVETVLCHSPTLLYGSDNETYPASDKNPVALEYTGIANVFPLLYYGDSAQIIDSDLTSPITHSDGDYGGFVATTIEFGASSSGTGIIVVSGASPYSGYVSMHVDDYNGIWNGSLFVRQVIDFSLQYESATASGAPIIVFDMSHGQYKESVFLIDDTWLAANLTALGYEIVWAWGGLTDSILENATGLVIGAIYGTENGFTAAELTAVDDWFNGGTKFLWVGTDSDYSGFDYINRNATAMLEVAGSHVYPEPTQVYDDYSNCGANYRVLANRTSEDSFVSPMVEGVTNVLMHGPTLLYGSNSTNPGYGIDPVALESTTIDEVYPLLYYGESAVIRDNDFILPLAHSDGASGSFVCATMETHTGATDSGIVVVSGSSPYGAYQPMSTSYYYDRSLEGDRFVRQVIDFGMKFYANPQITGPDDITYEEGLTGNILEWQAFHSLPKSYNITLDDVLLREGLWNSSTDIFSVIVDGLSVGIHNYTLQVESEFSNTKSDTASVTVLSQIAPTINHPDNITYYEGDNESEILWTPYDLNLYYYEIFKDGELNQTHYWLPEESADVSLYVGELPVGVYNFTICVYDKVLLSTVDTVWVEVLSATTTTTTTSTSTTTTSTTSTTTTATTTNSTTTTGDILDTLIIVISIGSAIVIIIVIVIIIRNRR